MKTNRQLEHFISPDHYLSKIGLVIGHWYFQPVFLNTQRLDLSKPALFVGNHTLYGILDIPFIIEHIRRQHDVHLRSLGDRVHFHIPVWKSLLSKAGMVLATPENCHELMRSGQSILVFPGGAREVMRRKDEQHQLIWKKRTGFARLAIAHGYDIIPFASVGADDCFDIHADADDVLHNKYAKKMINRFGLDRLLRGGDILPPFTTGLSYLPIPKPQRFYFSFGERISTVGVAQDQHGYWQVREQVAQSIEQQIAELITYRQHDYQNWGALRKILTQSNITKN